MGSNLRLLQPRGWVGSRCPLATIVAKQIGGRSPYADLAMFAIVFLYLYVESAQRAVITVPSTAAALPS